MKATDAGPYGIGSDIWPGLSKVVEEAGELTQVLGKLLGTGGTSAHWDGTDLRQRLIEELGDLRAALDFFEAANKIAGTRTREEEKYRLFWKWHHEARSAS